MARTEPQINIRIPAELKGRLETAAKANKRSVTAELLARIELTFESEFAAHQNGLNIDRDGRRSQDSETAQTGAGTYILREEIPAILAELAKTIGAELGDELRRLLNRKEPHAASGSASSEKKKSSSKKEPSGKKGTGRPRET